MRLAEGTEELELGAAFALAVPFALPDVRVFRRNVLSVAKADGRRVRAGIKGQSDYYALIRGGGHVEIEAKSATGSLSPAQRRWQSFCRSFDIPHLVVEGRRNEAPPATVGRWVDELRATIEASS